MRKLMSDKELKTVIERFGLRPDIQVKPIYILNVPVVFLGLNSKGLEMWKSKDGKFLYIMY